MIIERLIAAYSPGEKADYGTNKRSKKTFFNVAFNKEVLNEIQRFSKNKSNYKNTHVRLLSQNAFLVVP
ncbi:hypothetical protein MM221_19880 [Salipaludibacillus sp. LMS25]|jgi:hypothetical protein|uniref:hypothetical protein n=1 Tax=Salipaludibacillus sp. LMS25 TaxID=2924031 RepID=UPI0020D1C482|nr:hypothetical protein [Salipaludibacillus sp. LMS25]UTR14778.1 hypothetical protein MM221_19880 [Salipaludibacillus sp. LMS25]